MNSPCNVIRNPLLITIKLMQKSPQAKKAKKQVMKARRQLLRGAGRIPTVGGSIAGYQVPVTSVFRLSACAERYLDSLVDPFGASPDACVPMPPSFPTLKARVFARGPCVVGTAGVGWIIARPILSNSAPIATVTTAAFIGTAIDGAALGLTLALGNAPYLPVGGQGGVQWRCISCGVRVRYAGTELNRGGSILCLEEPDHLDFNAAGTTWSEPALRAYEKCHIFPVEGRDWTQVCWAPIQPSDLDFTTSPGIIGQGLAQAFCLAIFIRGVAGTSYDFEVFENCEIIGSAVRGKTSSHSDTTGYAAIQGGLRLTNDGQIDKAVVTHSIVDHSKDIAKILQKVGDYAAMNQSGFGHAQADNLAKKNGKSAGSKVWGVIGGLAKAAGVAIPIAAALL